MMENTKRTATPWNRKLVSFVVGTAIFSSVFMFFYMDEFKYQKSTPIPLSWQFQKKINNIQMNVTAPNTKMEFCKFRPHSPEDAQEEQLILRAIAWPETPLLPANYSLSLTSNPKLSTVIILPKEGGQQRYVGDLLKVLIKINDFRGIPKKTGGDFIIARLHNPVLHAGVVGQIVDHLNGSYTGVFPLLWNGSAEVEVTLIHPSEAIPVLHKLNRDRPDRIKFISVYSNGKISEASICNVCLRRTNVAICNYTDTRTGEPWFCYKPKTLQCKNRITHSKIASSLKVGIYQKLFDNKINLKVPIPLLGPGRVNVTDNGQRKVKESFGHAGFYYNGVWNSLSSAKVQRFNNSEDISQCLQGKNLHLYGDSTIRQWYEYLTGILPGLKGFNLHSLKKIGPLLALDYERNIFLEFQCHGPPIRFAKVLVPQLGYIANKLDDISGGANTVVVLGIWSHLGSFPLEIYIRRLQSIRSAVIRLLRRAPNTLVVIRTSNLKKLLFLYETLSNSDFYTMEREKILRAVFKGVNVRWVDAWEMTLAHYLPHELHPQPPIIKNMIDVLLSHICPLKSG